MGVGWETGKRPGKATNNQTLLPRRWKKDNSVITESKLCATELARRGCLATAVIPLTEKGSGTILFVLSGEGRGCEGGPHDTFCTRSECSRIVFINRINSKFFKRVKEGYAFSVDKKTHDRNIRLCTWRFNRILWEFPSGIVINCWRKEVNQGGSAPFAIESYGRRR